MNDYINDTLNNMLLDLEDTNERLERATSKMMKLLGTNERPNASNHCIRLNNLKSILTLSGFKENKGV